MPVSKISIEEFLAKAQMFPVIDVRSPGEFTHAHIPGAYSFPLFTDEERKVVGTAYKQQSKQAAIKFGLDFFGPKMRKMVEEVEGIVRSREWGVRSRESGVDSRESTVGSREPGVGNRESGVGSRKPREEKGEYDAKPNDYQLKTKDSILIHCWRGGMRSGAVAWLLDLYGFKVYTLDGG